MAEFIEQTEAEQGFAQHWDRFVKPNFDHYQQHYYRYLALALGGFVAAAAMFFIGAGFLLGGEGSNDTSLKIATLVLLGLCCGGGYLGYVPLKRLTDASGNQLAQALNAHFKSWITPIADTSSLKDSGEYLQQEGLTTAGSVKISSAYEGETKGTPYLFYNCRYTSRRSNGNNSSTTVVTYLIIHLKLNAEMPSAIRIKVDQGIMNIFGRIFTRKKNLRLANKAFEKRYEVYCDDLDHAASVITPELQDSFVGMHQYFATGERWFHKKSEISCLIEDDEMILCFSGLDDLTGFKLAGRSPKKIVDAAHTAIRQMTQIPFIVENMREVVPQLHHR
ncbi:MAG: DUF3137 domain-containing protein [Alphaproteobacteria bacterium]|nr:DUF3137 domain-containing protein [Alphaproteobacteria bacterium]